MKMKQILAYFIIIITASLSASAAPKETPGIEKARNARFYDNIFKEKLRTGYIELSDAEWNKGDKQDAVHYGEKAMAISYELDPEMENLYNRKITVQVMNNLLGAKYFLEAAFVKGIKEIIPDIAADAQVKFDCWLENEEEGEKSELIDVCKQAFEKNRQIIVEVLDDMKANEMENRRILKEQLEREAEMQAAKKFESQIAEQKAKMRKMPEYSLIFFRYNDTALGITGKGILDKVAKDIEIFQPRKVVISGHADKTGSYEYNMRLAMKRGQAMANYLIQQHGIDPNLLDVKAYGENDPRVYEGQHIKDVRNRYVRIIFLKESKTYYQ